MAAVKLKKYKKKHENMYFFVKLVYIGNLDQIRSKCVIMCQRGSKKNQMAVIFKWALVIKGLNSTNKNNKKFFLTRKILREIISLVTSLPKKLLSRNFWQNM